MIWRIESRKDQDSQGAVQWACFDPSVGDQFTQIGETADRLKTGESADSMESDDSLGVNGTIPPHGGHFTPFSDPLTIMHDSQAQRTHRGHIEPNLWRPCVFGAAAVTNPTSAEDFQLVAGND